MNLQNKMIPYRGLRSSLFNLGRDEQRQKHDGENIRLGSKHGV